MLTLDHIIKSPLFSLWYCSEIIMPQGRNHVEHPFHPYSISGDTVHLGASDAAPALVPPYRGVQGRHLDGSLV